MAETKSKINLVAALFYTLFIFLSLGQIGRITLFNQTISIYPHEVVMAIISILLVFCHSGRVKLSFDCLPRLTGSRIDSGFSASRRITRMTEGTKSLLLFVGALLLTFIFSIFRFTLLQNSVALLYLLRLVFYLFFFRLLRFVDNKVLRTSFLIFTVLTIIFSIGQYFFYPNLRNLYYLGWDPHQYRLFGTFFDTTTMGIIFVLAFFFVTHEHIKYKLLLQTVILCLILLTYSRITYISFLIGTVYYFINSHKIGYVICVMCIFVIALFLLPRPGGEGVKLERSFSIKSRFADNERAIHLFFKNPLFGVGYNHIRFVKDQKVQPFPNHAESAISSSFMTILVSSGLFGLVAFFYLMRDLFKKTNSLGRTTLIVVMTASFFDNVFLQNFILLMTLSIVGYSFNPMFRHKTTPEVN